MSEYFLITLSSIIILGIGAQWLAWRLKLPSILLLLIFGFIAGPLTGFLKPDELMGDILLPIVSITVALILFEGGLTLKIKGLPKIGSALLLLLTAGVLITWAIAASAAYYIIGLNLQIAILLGAILVVTGPTVIGPLLRHIRPIGKVAKILKWEGIVIDPIGALLALLVFEAILIGGFQEASMVVLVSLGKTLLFGSIVGFTFAWFLVLLLKKFWIPDFLQETVTLSLVVAAFITSDVLQAESGLLATTLMGIVMANQKFVTVKHILEFKENLSVLIISFLFIILSARLDFTVFQNLSYTSLIFLSVLVFIARPASVFLSTIGSGFSWKERVFLSWMAPRGIVAAAVSSIFALRLAETNLPQTEFLVPITFIVIVGTVALYGLTAAPLARYLKVAQANPQGVLLVGAHSWGMELAKELKENKFAVALIDTNRENIYRAKMAEIPAYRVSALSEQLYEELNLDGIGKLLAITSNDEANSLACLHLRDLFDSKEIYQLKPEEKTKGNEQSFLPKHLRGRYLFGDKISFDYMTDKLASGSIFQTSKLTEEFDFSSYLEHYGKEVVLLFVITEDKQLEVITAESERTPKPNQSIIALVPDDKNNE